MKSNEKKTLLGFIASVISCTVQLNTPSIAEPTDILSLVITIASVLWFVANIVGLVWSLVLLMAFQIIKLISRYRSAKRNYLNNHPVRLPAFFRFMKWLNTDD